MDRKLSPKGVYLQAVLPAGIYTELWDRAGIDISSSSKMMQVNELVDAALVGFDRRERVTIPPLHNAARWDSLDAARQALLSDINQAGTAERYKTAK
jgi:short-subunit dehydrogenase